MEFSEALVADLRRQLAMVYNSYFHSRPFLFTCMLFSPFSKYVASYTCKMSGPGLSTATVNHPTHVVVELFDTTGQPYPTQLNVTADLEQISKATLFVPAATASNSTRRLKSKKSVEKRVSVATTSFYQYKVLYTAFTQGQYNLHVRVNDREINGSPFRLTVHVDPTQLSHPVAVLANLSGPSSIAYNSSGQMIISESCSHRVSVFDDRGKPIRTLGSYGERPEQMIAPAGIAVDDSDNIYISSEHKLQKFSRSGRLIKCTGRKGTKEGEFDDPRGVTLYKTNIYVCDRNNHRFQVFDLDMNFVRSIGSRGKRKVEFDTPLDVQFDATGNMYVSELGNKRVQVFDSRGKSIRMIGQEGEGKLRAPSGLHVTDKHVYVSDSSNHCVVVYETSGLFLTSFGSYGQADGKFDSPYGITSCVDGHIYVCDCDNNRVQIF